MKKIIGCVFCMIVSLSARAQSWNLANDFSINSNPNGQWTYGSTTSVGGPFTVFSRTAQIPYQVWNGAVAEWVGTYYSGFELFPYISKFYGDPGTTVSVVSGTVSGSIVDPANKPIIKRAANGVGVHPAPPGQGYATIRWTAPKSNIYFINTAFFSIDLGLGATTDVHVQKNHVSLFDGFLNGVGSIQNWSTSLQGISLTAGDIIDLVVGPNGDYTADSTAIDATIQVLPDMLNCAEGSNIYKAVKLSNSVSANVSPNMSGIPSICALPSSKPTAWYIKTSTDNGVTWQWIDTLGSFGLGEN